VPRDPDGAVPPIFLWDARAGELRAFASAAEAARHLAPWQEVGSAVAYDAEGRELAFAVELRARRILGVPAGRREVVVVRGVEAEPGHARELRAALVAALERAGAARAAVDDRPLAALVAEAARCLGPR
jgi:hypothetical protein